MNFDELSKTFAKYLTENQGENVQIYDVENKNKTTKRIVVCQKEKEIYVKKLAKQFLEYANQVQKPLHTDGIFKGEWVVFDFDEVIVHVITNHAKQKYTLDKLYKDYKIVKE